MLTRRRRDKLMRHTTPAAFKAQAALLQTESIPTPDWFVEAYFGNATVENFISILQQLPPGVSEVEVHPGMVDGQLRSLGGGYVEQREVELAVLLNPRVRDAFATHHVKPVSFSFLKQDRKK